MTLREKQPSLYSILISGLIGLITASEITSTLYQQDLTAALDWIIAFLILTLGFGFLYAISLQYTWSLFQNASLSARIWVIALAIISAIFFSLPYGYLSFIIFFFVGFVLASYGIPSFDEFINQKRSARFMVAAILGGAISFFGMGFFKNFHPAFWEFILITALLNISFTFVFEFIVQRFITSVKNNLINKIISIGIIALSPILLAMIVLLLVQYPTMFPPSFFLPDLNLIPAFLGLVFLSQSWSAFVLQKLDKARSRSSTITLWIERHLPGLLSASAISASAYLLGAVLVSKNLALADNYFDTDSPIWVSFLTDNADDIHPMRAVHPYVLMLLRPLVWLLSLLLNGDKFHAAILLNAIAGGLCVFLTWLFFKHRTGNTTYSLLISTLIGLSTSHLLLSAFLESYIFSAAILTTSVLLFQNRDTKLKHAISVGLVTFGITVTNFIQTCITFLLTQWDIKKTFKFVFITIALATVLSFIQTTIQPKSQPFYIPSNIGSENAFQRDVVNVPISETISRANVITRTITLFSVVAPRPLILLEEIGCSSPCFNTIRFFRGKYQYASYIGFGSWLARSWFGLLGIATLIFLWNLIRKQKDVALQAALALNLLFNFVLHMNYGDDPMLYSPNWTYALVFFFGLSFEKLADRKWIQVGLLIFLTALLFNNVDLFRKMLDAIQPYYGL